MPLLWWNYSYGEIGRGTPCNNRLFHIFLLSKIENNEWLSIYETDLQLFQKKCEVKGSVLVPNRSEAKGSAGKAGKVHNVRICD